MTNSTQSQEYEAYLSHYGGRLFVLVLAVLIPGLVILATLGTVVFLCWYRDRIPIFRNKARKFASPGAKTQVPLSGGRGGAYPTQAVSKEKGEEEAGREAEEAKVEYHPRAPIPDDEVVVAVDVSQSSKF